MACYWGLKMIATAGRQYLGDTKIAQTISQVEAWLLGPRVQRRTEPFKGGIVGWLDARGRAEFVYMEISGYYLTFLAFLLQRQTPQLKLVWKKAQATISWLSKTCLGDSLPLTREYFCPHRDDWRNAAIFAFDIGMVARGVFAIYPYLRSAACKDLLSMFVSKAELFCDASGLLRSYVLLHESGPPLPAKWSTRPGVFLLKPAASFLMTSTELPAGKIHTTAKATILQWQSWCTLPRELHPAFYAIEGMILLGEIGYDPHCLKQATQWYEEIMEHQSGDGWMPAVVDGGWDEVQSDVMAQALRAGSILRSCGHLEGDTWGERLNILADRLCDFVREDGSVVFWHPSTRRPVHANTWSAMFAHQALCFYEMVRSGSRLAREWTRLLI